VFLQLYYCFSLISNRFRFVIFLIFASCLSALPLHLPGARRNF
jgi:hypothetical protein